MRKYRIEKWHNGHTRPKSWTGTGQPVEYEKTEPTYWCLMATNIKTGKNFIFYFIDVKRRNNAAETLLRINDE